MGILYRIALVLVIIGALNWGLIGFFRFDLVASIFGGQTAGLSRIVYALVGIAGLISIPILMKPLTNDEDIAFSSDSRVNNNPNYSMEAGREEDFSDLEKPRNNNNKK
ncbi:MAG: DUF378 domain-containing protein [Solibacillus sp.]|uniref:DUF378 domain-containing protein n=1 Tax=unclassified Solibacillus TaxID=2637870 RepID=UPI0030F73DBF